jgi:integrase
VQPSGVKSWAVRYRHANKTRKLTLGSWPAIDLATARDLGSKALRRVAEGYDPAGEKIAKASLATDIVEHVIDDFIRRYVQHKRTAYEIERILRLDVVPRWRGRRIGDITRRDVIALVDAIEERGAPVMACRTLDAVKSMFGWCVSKDIVSISPCAGISAGRSHQRDRVLSDAELRLVWNAAGVISPRYGAIFRLLILTGCRRGEIADLRWSEVDLDMRLIKLPRERVKNDRPHEVYLTDMALAVLEPFLRVRNSDRVFPSGSFGGAKALLDAATAAGNPGTPVPAWRTHDLRRTVATGMARLGINLPVIERTLNHVSGSFGGIVGVYQHYSYADEKRRALEAWAAFVKSLVGGTPANVTRLADVREAV